MVIISRRAEGPGREILQCPPSVCLSVRPSVRLEILKVPLHLLVKWEVVSPDSRYRDSGNLYPIVVLASEPVGGRSPATELPCLYIEHTPFFKNTLYIHCNLHCRDLVMLPVCYVFR